MKKRALKYHLQWRLSMVKLLMTIVIIVLIIPLPPWNKSASYQKLKHNTVSRSTVAASSHLSFAASSRLRSLPPLRSLKLSPKPQLLNAATILFMFKLFNPSSSTFSMGIIVLRSFMIGFTIAFTSGGRPQHHVGMFSYRLKCPFDNCKSFQAQMGIGENNHFF